jgi:hypothetical protein
MLLLWQIALTGYTYVAAGHAAREGARELATDPTDPSDDEGMSDKQRAKEPYYVAATEDLKRAWRKNSAIELRGEATVSVRLQVPLIIPGIKSPLTIGSTADTFLEDGGLTDRQDSTPFEGKFGEDGNWN